MNETIIEESTVNAMFTTKRSLDRKNSCQEWNWRARKTSVEQSPYTGQKHAFGTRALKVYQRGIHPTRGYIIGWPMDQRVDHGSRDGWSM